MTKIKPCPCCGGAAHMITRPQIGNLSGGDGFLSTIKCLGGCDCGLEVSAWALKKAWAIESVTKKWNRRVNEEVPRWIPVTERLPEIGQIVFLTDGREVGFAEWTGRRWNFENDLTTRVYKPTHWMPLPKAPEVEE